jgi:phosphoribosylanthranilate isomerase
MTRVKICGITRVEDGLAAAAAGADAIGLVFWPKSPRVVDPAAARDLVRQLPPFVSSVGVFVDQPVGFVNEVAEFVGLSAVQLHGDEPPSTASRIVRPVIKAIGLPRDSRRVEEWPDDVPLLVDAIDPNSRGGTGKVADWAAAAPLARLRLVILAGGLGPANVGKAIHQVRPWAVDVSSGVERAQGIKDAAMMAAFCTAVRVADGEAVS